MYSFLKCFVSVRDRQWKEDEKCINFYLYILRFGKVRFYFYYYYYYYYYFYYFLGGEHA